MKKVFVFSFLVLFAILLASSFVFAQETNFEVFVEKIGATNLDVNFSVILFGLLVWMVLYSVFSKMVLFENSVWWSSAVALIVTLLSFIYIPKELLDAQGPLYGALGGTIITVIPFAIAVYFTVWVTRSYVIARAIWGIFFLYYLVIFFFGPVDILKIKNIDQAAAVQTVNLPYFGATPITAIFFVAAGIAALFLFYFIGPLRELAWKEHVRGVEERIKKRTKMYGLGLRAGEAAAKEAGSASK